MAAVSDVTGACRAGVLSCMRCDLFDSSEVTVDITAEESCTVKELLVKADETVQIGTVLAKIERGLTDTHQLPPVGATLLEKRSPLGSEAKNMAADPSYRSGEATHSLAPKMSGPVNQTVIPVELAKTFDKRSPHCESFKGSSPFAQSSPSVTGSTRSTSCSRFQQLASSRSNISGSLDEQPRPIVTPALRWRVSIDRGDMENKLGLEIVDIPATKGRAGALKIVDVYAGGLTYKWNKAHNNKTVQPGDFIAEANGVHGSPDELRAVLMHDSFVDMMVLRGT